MKDDEATGAVSLPEKEFEGSPGPSPLSSVESNREVEAEVSEHDETAESPSPEPEPEPEPDPDPDPEPPTPAVLPPIDDLFARLRAGEPAEASTPPEAKHPVAEPEGMSVEDAEAIEGPVAAAAPAEEPTRPQLDATAAIEIRERLLLPIQNRTLRDVKQAIVELQNVALEEIRTSAGSYSPDGADNADLIAPGLDSGATQAYAAGFAAAAEMAGSPATPPVTGGPEAVAAEVADALAGAAEAAHRRVVAADGGSREAAAAVSRVFRAWRTDEAERRVRAATQRAYHTGLLAGLAGAGVDRVVAVTQGAACAACPSVPGEPWDPALGMPAGFPPPPAHVGGVPAPVPVAPGA